MASAMHLLAAAASSLLLSVMASEFGDVCKDSTTCQDQPQSAALLQKVFKRDEKIASSVNENLCGWKLAPSCMPEFDYEGAHYIGTCVEKGHDIPWCSHTNPYDGSWSHCMYSCEETTADTPSDTLSDIVNELNTPSDIEEACTWEPAKKCQESFRYKGLQYNGCTDSDYPTPWCSHDQVHKGDWSACKRVCTTTFTTTQPPAVFLTMPLPQRPPEAAGWINRNVDYMKKAEMKMMGGKRSGGFGGSRPGGGPVGGGRRRAEETEEPEECSAMLLRFSAINDINAVKPISQGHDPFFPASASSIAPAGANCGDSAHGLHDPCSKYNHWQSMDSISKARGFPFTVFDTANGIPHHTDVQQGGLGTCYFLSAIASIAYRAPNVIADMFVRREYWREGLLSTSWLINGKVSIIEVDKTVPAKNNRPFFTTLCKETGAWWPAILEKAWSKVYSSYKGAEAGFWAIAAAAITRAPTVTYYHSEWKGEELWKVLVEASENKWPMGAGTTESHFGLAAGHAYSVLEAWHDPKRGRLVKMRNPWHTNFYKGSQPNPNYGDDTGIFTMSYSEFEVAFFSNSVAKVEQGYDVTSVQVAEKNGIIEGSYTFTVKSNKWFAVSVVWPNHRMLCKVSHPAYVLAVRKVGTDEAYRPKPAAYASNAVYVEIPEGGAGTYTVTVSADFPVNTFIHEVYLNVYAEEPVSLEEEQGLDYQTKVLGMVGPSIKNKPCNVVMLEDAGLWTVNNARLVHGVPTYDSWDGTHFAYYVSQHDKWFLTNSQTWEKVSKGEKWSHAQVEKEDFTCGCKDSEDGLSEDLGCDRVMPPNLKYGNVRCDKTVQYTAWAQAYCPVACNLNVCSTQVSS